MNDKEVLRSIGEAALKKQEISAGKPLLYFSRSFLAGIFIVLGIVLSYCAGALLFQTDAGLARIINALSMSIALMLIVFIGGELFTGINLVMSIGFYEKKCSLSGVLRVWLFCWLGNLAACIVFGSLFAFSGAGGEPLKEYLTATIEVKQNLEWHILIIRGIFANFCVCCAVLAAFKLKSESAKLIVIAVCVFAFIVCGFEHGIANMGLFTVAAFYTDNFDFFSAFKNIMFSSFGNVLGGAVMLGLPYWAVNRGE